MAHKSKSQKRRASERRQAKKNIEQVVDTKVEEPIVNKIEKTTKSVKKEEKGFVNYLQGVRGELARTTWPTKSETKNASVVVFVSLLFFGLLFYLVDSAIVPMLFAYSNF